MENLLDVARRVLERHPSPALPYTELHRLICAERPGPRPDPDFLLRRIRSRRDLFRVVDPWRGPWRRLTASPEAGRYRTALAAAGLPVDLWVVAAEAAEGREDVAEVRRSFTARVRRTVLDLSRRVDANSPRAMARWIRLLGEQRALRRCLEPG